LIPLPEDRVSVGVVAPLGHLIRPEKKPPQEVFDEELEACEGLKTLLEGARQAGPVQVIRDFTYRSRQRAGDGWVLVGDAYGFIDPLYSTGVLLALKGGEMAADAIAEGLAADDVSGARLGAFEPVFLRGMEAFRRLVYAFYDKDFSIGGFLKQHPEFRDDVVQVLVGNVFDGRAEAMFEPMARMTTLPEPWA
jgi:flavin-dependent dehydrogenase